MSENKPSRAPDFDVVGGDVPRRLFPTGRIRFSLGATGAEAKDRRTYMRRLRKTQEWEILKAIVDGRITVSEVYLSLRRNGEDGGVAAIKRRLERDVANDVPTLQEEIDQFLAEYKNEKRPLSYTNTRSRLKQVSEHRRSEKLGDSRPLGSIPITEITSEDIRAAVRAPRRRKGTAEKQARPTSSNTRENLRSAISAVFTRSIAVEESRAKAEKRAPKWTENPAGKVKSFSREVRLRVLVDEDVVRLLAAAEPYQEAYLRAFVELGLREAELIHTRLGLDLNTARWTWKIQEHPRDDCCPCEACGHTGWKPKSHESKRTLNLRGRPELRGAILRYLEQYPAKVGDYLFRNPATGEIWRANALAGDFSRLCERAEVEYGRDGDGATLHTLRHTCATNLLRAGVTIPAVAKILGDKISTVMKTYAHPTEEDAADGLTQGPRFE